MWQLRSNSECSAYADLRQEVDDVDNNWQDRAKYFKEIMNRKDGLEEVYFNMLNGVNMKGEKVGRVDYLTWRVSQGPTRQVVGIVSRSGFLFIIPSSSKFCR